jgi:hypothetical protein
MADLNLPAAAPPPPPPVPVGSTMGNVTVKPAEPAPVDTTVTESDLLQKVSNALAVLGIDPATVKAHVVAQLEAAASAFASTSIPHDKSAIQAEGMRLLAAIHALFSASAPAPAPAPVESEFVSTKE